MKLSPAINFTNIVRAAFAPIFFQKKLRSQTLTGEILQNTFFTKKAAHKMLVKLTPCPGNIPS